MKPLELKFSATLVRPLIEWLRPLSATLEERMAQPENHPQGDPEWESEWEEELLGLQMGDVGALLALFGDSFEATGHVTVTPDQCESVLRGAAGVRLLLREKYLASVGDAELEVGGVDFAALGPQQRQAYASYVMLATLQELVIEHLDPGSCVLERPEPPDPAI